MTISTHKGRKTERPSRKRTIRAFAKDRRGGALAEMAIVLPIMLLFVVGVFEFGRVLYASHTIDHAAREAVRYAIVHGSMSDDIATDKDIEAVVEAKADTLDLDKIEVNTTFEPNNAPGSVVTVVVTYDFEPLTQLVDIGPVTLARQAGMIILQ